MFSDYIIWDSASVSRYDFVGFIPMDELMKQERHDPNVIPFLQNIIKLFYDTRAVSARAFQHLQQGSISPSAFYGSTQTVAMYSVPSSVGMPGSVRHKRPAVPFTK